MAYDFVATVGRPRVALIRLVQPYDRSHLCLAEAIFGPEYNSLGVYIEGMPF